MKGTLENPDRETLYRGAHLHFCRPAGGKWEYVSRSQGHGVVGVVAIDEEGNLLLVEQWRPPVASPVIELPAGLAGDEACGDAESLLESARRELLEETGYEAEHWQRLVTGCSSAGLTDEQVTLFLATGLVNRREEELYGVGSERIRLHRVPLQDLLAFLEEKQAKDGCAVDFKVYAGVFLARDQSSPPSAGQDSATA